VLNHAFRSNIKRCWRDMPPVIKVAIFDGLNKEMMQESRGRTSRYIFRCKTKPIIL